jgi:small subunit ribosomal protein S1
MDKRIIETAKDKNTVMDNSSSACKNSFSNRHEPISAYRDDSDEDMMDAGNFMELYEDSLKRIQEGEVVTGEIVQINKEFVLVDIGYKSEGQIPVKEFVDAQGNLTAHVGDRIDVLLERREDEDGKILLSRKKAAKIKIWDKIRDVYQNDGTIRGKIVSRVKGGLAVDIGLPAFLPGSQIALRPVKEMDELLDTEHDFKIVKYNKRRENIVLSRRIILEAERTALRESTIQLLKEGAVLQGKVKNITDYGLFIDLGGIDGLVHITDMSWGRLGHPSEVYQIGNPITVKVLSFDKERERVSLGIKQLTTDPWTEAEIKFPAGSKLRGRVVSLTDYGAFVEVVEGVEGLVHVSEMSWTKKIRHPSQVVTPGQSVDVIVLSVDPTNKRISLGMKQAHPNPWEVVAGKYPVGTIIEGTIRNITDFGIFIGIDEGIDGLVHISDFSWTKKIKHPSEVYQKEQAVQAVVLNIDKESHRFSLGIKQLEPDPWERIPERYQPGTRVTGTVTNVTDFGIFVEIEEGIEGLIHVSEVSADGREKPLSHFQMDDVIQAKVVHVEPEEKKIGLSIRQLQMEETDDQERTQPFASDPSLTLGQKLREQLMNLELQSLSEKALSDSPKRERPLPRNDSEKWQAYLSSGKA